MLKATNNRSQQTNSNIFVKQIQKNNKIILNEFDFSYNLTDDITSDFLVKHTDFSYDCFFLSMKYHELFPEYIEKRLNEAIKDKGDNSSYNFILFLFIDIQLNNEDKHLKLRKQLTSIFSKYSDEYIHEDMDYDSNITDPKEKYIYDTLFRLNLLCFEKKVFLVLCFQAYDVGQYIHALSLLKTNITTGNLQISRLTEEENLMDSLCCIDKINKTDAINLLKHFRDIRSISFANTNLLKLVPKMKQNKIEALESFLNYDFDKFKNS